MLAVAGYREISGYTEYTEGLAGGAVGQETCRETFWGPAVAVS